MRSPTAPEAAIALSSCPALLSVLATAHLYPSNGLENAGESPEVFDKVSRRIQNLFKGKEEMRREARLAKKGNAKATEEEATRKEPLTVRCGGVRQIRKGFRNLAKCNAYLKQMEHAPERMYLRTARHLRFQRLAKTSVRQGVWLSEDGEESELGISCIKELKGMLTKSDELVASYGGAAELDGLFTKLHGTLGQAANMEDLVLAHSALEANVHSLFGATEYIRAQLDDLDKEVKRASPKLLLYHEYLVDWIQALLDPGDDLKSRQHIEESCGKTYTKSLEIAMRNCEILGRYQLGSVAMIKMMELLLRDSCLVSRKALVRFLAGVNRTINFIDLAPLYAKYIPTLTNNPPDLLEDSVKTIIAKKGGIPDLDTAIGNYLGHSEVPEELKACVHASAGDLAPIPTTLGEIQKSLKLLQHALIKCKCTYPDKEIQACPTHGDDPEPEPSAFSRFIRRLLANNACQKWRKFVMSRKERSRML